MANYLKLFENETAYSAFTGSSEYVTPNVSVCSGGGGSIFYNPLVKHDYSKDYFTTVAKTNGIISFSGSSSNALSYSTDNGATWSSPAQEPSVNVNAGDKVLWKGTCTPNSSYGIGKFTTNTAEFDVEGNVMSLLYGDNFKGQTSLVGKSHAFIRLFIGNTKVVSAENLSLPATTLADACYNSMFSGCTSLTTAPSVLPATTLANGCYLSMFKDCTSLTTPPELPATTLADACYNEMFWNCTSLTTAPELPAMTLAYNCYDSMFYGCTSLTTAPELSATTLVNECYTNMFAGCINLNNITCLATDISASDCTYYWVYDVDHTGTFTKAASMEDWTTDYDGIPYNWDVVDKE